MTEESLLSLLGARVDLVPETAELSTIARYGVHHVDLGTSKVAAAAQLEEHDEIVDAAIGWAQRKVGKGGNRKLVAIRSVERLAVEFARKLLTVVDGDISVEVDGRLAYKRRSLIDRARALMDQLEEAGVPKDRVLLKIPATWEGIQAMEKVTQKNGIRCHASLVFGMHQLAAAADAGVTVIAPAVGRITDWHKKKDGVDGYPPGEDPGVLRALQMLDYLEQHGYGSALMPGTFRAPEQALALARCPRISLPVKLISLLAEQQGGGLIVAERTSEPSVQDKLVIDSSNFSKMNKADPVSDSKLMSGVKNLSWSVVAQEKQLVDWITGRQDRAAESSTLALFRIWDYDGDGFIDREEWSGTPEVFNALDRDNNGRISLEEMALGLGAPYSPEE